jgi:hypothetical protein
MVYLQLLAPSWIVTRHLHKSEAGIELVIKILEIL